VQGSVNDVGTGVCLLTVAAALNINLCHNIGTGVNLALTHNGAVNAQTLHGLLNVLNVNDEAVAGNDTGLSCLAIRPSSTPVCPHFRATFPDAFIASIPQDATGSSRQTPDTPDMKHPYPNSFRS